MIYRHYYTAQLLDGVSFGDIEKQLGGSYTAPEAVVSITVSAWCKRLFLYFETRDVEELSPDVLWSGLESFLELWPGAEEKRLWVPMFDIFHYNAPVVDEEWMRHTEKVPFCMLMTIRPEKLASYIFYHHQLQEEDPGCGAQHAVIAMHENLLFHYMENPENENCLVAKGSLNTHNTPDHWGELMEQHFAPWPDTDPPIQWRKDLTTVFHTETIIPYPSN